MESAPPLRGRDKLRRLALWFLLFTGPAAWALHQQSTYSLVLHVCHSNHYLSMRIVSAVLIAITVLAGVVAAFFVRQTPRTPANVRSATAVDAERFLAILALMGSVLFLLVMIGQVLARCFISPCQD